MVRAAEVERMFGKVPRWRKDQEFSSIFPCKALDICRQNRFESQMIHLISSWPFFSFYTVCF